jgi:LPS-assembly protein
LFAIAAAHAEPSSCPQQDYSQELPPMPADPRLEMHADQSLFERNGISTLSGSVFMSQNGREFAAQSLHYDGAARRIDVESQSLFRDRDVFIIRSDQAHYDLNNDRGQFLGTQFSLPKQSSRGSSERIDLEEQNTATLTAARYTGCSPEHESWVLQSSTLKLDQEEGLGTAHNAVLRFGGVPVFYVPYFRFPIDDQRRTGMLVPTFGESTRTGLDLRVPVYLNLAPNYDATLTPRIMSRRGEQIQGDFRYLLSHSEGTLHGEYLPYDQETHVERNYVDYSQQTLISRQLAFDAHYAEVSDLNYFADLGGKYDSAATPYLERVATLTYQAPAQYSVKLLAQDFQPLAGLTSAQNPYQRLPAILFDGRTKNRYLGFGAGLDTDFSNFSRSDSVEGQRLYADPYIRWEEDRSSWFAAAQSDLTYTAYNLTGTLANDQPSEPRRTLPQFSLDGGLRFERLTGNGDLQTLEPRLFYLYVPYRDQAQLPLFDTGAPDFDFPQLYSTNRYSGIDRISDANQLTTAVTTRVLDPDLGRPQLTASLGQIYRFQAPRVALPNENTPDRGSSDYVANVDYTLSRRWAAESIVLWSPDSGSFDRTEAGVRYRGEASRFDLSYRYLHGSYRQADASFSAPVSGNWRLAGRLRYSIQDQSLLDTFAGVEYDTCCWALQTFYRRYLASIDGQFNDGVYFQVVLKGLTHLGSGFNTLLPPDE